jgi:hypothetical protein
MELIKVKHPLETCNQQQNEFLISCPNEQRRFHELMFNYGNAVYQYHTKAEGYQPTEDDFNDWLDGLPEQIRNDMKNKGFESCKTVLPFTRYVNEKNDLGLEEFVMKLMGEDLYKEYRGMVNI